METAAGMAVPTSCCASIHRARSGHGATKSPTQSSRSILAPARSFSSACTAISSRPLNQHRPEHFYVVTPDADHPVNTYRVNGYSAYFRLLRRSRLEAFVDESDDEALAAANYPEPVDHCDVCAWSSVCSAKRRHDDHLSLVAGITRIQRAELQTQDITTVVELANDTVAAHVQAAARRDAFLRSRSRAGSSFRSRRDSTDKPVFELIQPIEVGEGALSAAGTLAGRSVPGLGGRSLCRRGGP